MSAKLQKITKLNPQDAEAAVTLKRRRARRARSILWLISGCFVYVYGTLRPQPVSVSISDKLRATSLAPRSYTALQLLQLLLLLLPKPKPTAVRHLTNIPLICYTWQAATRP